VASAALTPPVLAAEALDAHSKRTIRLQMTALR
jgi:hypothetical protein